MMTAVLTKDKSTIIEEYDQNYRRSRLFAEEIEHQVKSILDASSIAYNSVVSRVKERDSVVEKIDRKQGKYTHLSDITDIVGVRIIAYYSGDVDRISQIIEKEFDVDFENSIDKGKSLEPDRFGYCSVHYVVGMNADRLALPENHAYVGMKCEIQIRTVLQHAWAEIEHDIGYKSEITIPKEIRRSFSRIAGLLEIADKEFEEIRGYLAEYRKSITQQIKKKELADREIDAVILDVILDNDRMMLLNNHIASLFRASLGETIDDSERAMTIRELKSVGITTVGQLIDASVKYIETAMFIATQILKDYDKKDDKKNISKTIGFFYLAYAVLLTERCSMKDIKTYLVENQIGVREDIEKVAQELYNIGKLIKNNGSKS